MAPRRPRLLPPVYLLIAIVLLFALDRFAPGRRVVPPPWHWLGLGLAIASFGLGLPVVALFRRHHTTIIPGRAPTHLICDGPFALTRNPMYLGMTLILVGL